MYLKTITLLSVAILTAYAGMAAAQSEGSSNTGSNAIQTGKTILLDSDGNVLTDNEFVDIRMANFHYPDATQKRVMPNGDIEFRTQKIPQEGMAAPDVSLTTIDGREINFNDLRGKVIVLGFWFIGCPACAAETPKLNELRTKFKDSEEVIFLAMTADPRKEVEKYLKKFPLDYMHATDAKAAMDKFTFTGFPRSIVIDKNGVIVYWRSTVKAWDKFESVIKTELEKQ